jgi:hypothetical protein
MSCALLTSLQQQQQTAGQQALLRTSHMPAVAAAAGSLALSALLRKGRAMPGLRHLAGLAAARAFQVVEGVLVQVAVAVGVGQALKAVKAALLGLLLPLVQLMRTTSFPW